MDLKSFIYYRKLLTKPIAFAIIQLNECSTVQRRERSAYMQNNLTAPLCECEHIREGIGRELPSEERIRALAELFKLVGDETRLRILFALDGGELCVCEISEIVGMTKSAVSHQLRELRQKYLVKFRRSGKNVYYSLADSHVVDIIERALEHVGHI